MNVLDLKKENVDFNREVNAEKKEIRYASETKQALEGLHFTSMLSGLNLDDPSATWALAQADEAIKEEGTDGSTEMGSTVDPFEA